LGETESPNSTRPKKTRQMKSKVKSKHIAFFDIKGRIHKEFVLVGQTVNSIYIYIYIYIYIPSVS
jgi:hypothetical protein